MAVRMMLKAATTTATATTAVSRRAKTTAPVAAAAVAATWRLRAMMTHQNPHPLHQTTAGVLAGAEGKAEAMAQGQAGAEDVAPSRAVASVRSQRVYVGAAGIPNAAKHD